MKKKIIGLFLVLCIISSIIIVLPTVVSASASINIGEYLQMGTYYGEPILWRCVDIDENGPLMLSDKIICLKPFDASGTNTQGSHGRGQYYKGTQGYYRQQWGSNYWADSNIRCWLNSEAPAGNVIWACGNPPDNEHVQQGYNDYANEAGFLTNFTQDEINAIKEVTQKSLLDGYEYSDSSNKVNPDFHVWYIDMNKIVQNFDTAFSEQVTDRMFLLDVKQVTAVYNNSSILGDNYYIGEPTVQCVANSEYKDESYLEIEKKWYSWLRTPIAYDYYYCGSYGVCCICSHGNIYYGADDGRKGVRPAFYINLSTCTFICGNGSEESPYVISGEAVDALTQTEKPIAVCVNGSQIEFDQPPIIQDGRTLVPLRAIFEALSAEVNWEDTTKTVTAQKDTTIIKITIGDNKLYRNNTIFELDVPAQIVNDRTLVPVHAISEAFGCKVDWNGDTKTVEIQAE